MTPEQLTCPVCGKDPGPMVDLEQAQPNPGDVYLCCLCTAVSVWEEDAVLRPMSKSDLDALSEDQRNALARALHSIAPASLDVKS